jgi:hypothetical protein
MDRDRLGWPPRAQAARSPADRDSLTTRADSGRGGAMAGGGATGFLPNILHRSNNASTFPRTKMQDKEQVDRQDGLAEALRKHGSVPLARVRSELHTARIPTASTRAPAEVCVCVCVGRSTVFILATQLQIHTHSSEHSSTHRAGPSTSYLLIPIALVWPWLTTAFMAHARR